eukprot:CAMPEP_0113326538 /NCGR_PEP_ID=MMETSP0010_2-20120614/18588_1 /TAXON_ID=216773 ORGANISM="Corethron hystrix, Strain 308" /NCGR_SAMPLE_ID=MMETSP0010_2 /ASSEMBLY_ACC=CAM_ASM_000155 /LENGTH=287 /DNA_ID=CAMNT_0000186903 /DNA_START=262 /DNA_END=1126 /DNA_ORIENTATION=+ /assembly_acc=CAM_ASM_000155
METKSDAKPAAPNPVSDEASAAAEKAKETGNKAFAAGEFSAAVTAYTEAIKLNRTNHVYYSNRSASHGALKNWTKAAADARECIKMSPLFIKGYYRLVTALLELNQLDDALRAVRSGLQLDSSNPQLEKLLRQIKVRKAAEKKRQSANDAQVSASSGSSAKPRTADDAVAKEMMDLQEQFVATSREYNVVNANISKAQREQKVADLTRKELRGLDEGTKMYRGIGKMFVLSSHGECMKHLQSSIDVEKAAEKELMRKKDYLEKRRKSQQLNIQELTGSLVDRDNETQ